MFSIKFISLHPNNKDMSTELKEIKKVVEKTPEQIEEEETLERMKAANPAFYDMIVKGEGKDASKYSINCGSKCMVGEYHGLNG